MKTQKTIKSIIHYLTGKSKAEDTSKSHDLEAITGEAAQPVVGDAVTLIGEPPVLDDTLSSYVEAAKTLLEQSRRSDYAKHVYDPDVLGAFASNYRGKTPMEIIDRLGDDIFNETRGGTIGNHTYPLQALVWASIKDTDIPVSGLKRLIFYSLTDRFVKTEATIKLFAQPEYLRDVDTDDLEKALEYVGSTQRAIFVNELLGRSDVSIYSLERMTSSDHETNRILTLKAVDQFVRYSQKKTMCPVAETFSNFNNDLPILMGMVLRYLYNESELKRMRDTQSPILAFARDFVSSLQETTYKYLAR